MSSANRGKPINNGGGLFQVFAKTGKTTSKPISVTCVSQDEADAIADHMQAKYPNEEFAVVEIVFRRYTK